MNREELLGKKNHSLKMKDLREFLEKNKHLSDDAPCIVERVEDVYFEGREFNGKQVSGWDVLKVEGYHYNSSVEWNKCYEDNYDLDFEPAIFGEKELEAMKEQFYQPHCITTDGEIIYIYSHY